MTDDICIFAAPFTPVTDDGAVNYDMIPKYIDMLVKNHVKNVFVLGSNGEGMSFHKNDRMKIAEKWVEAGKGKLDRIIVHVSSEVISTTKELAQHATDLGVDGVAVMSPTFFLLAPRTPDDMVDYLSEIALAVPECSLYFYHFEGVTASTAPPHKILERASTKIPNFKGMKFTSGDLQELCRCLRCCDGKYEILLGCDDLLIAAMTVGCVGATGGLFNYLGTVTHDMVEAHNNGDKETAKLLQYRIQDSANIIFGKYGGVKANKAVMRMVGLPVGPTVWPLPDVSAADCTKMRAELEAIGFFDWCDKL